MPKPVRSFEDRVWQGLAVFAVTLSGPLMLVFWCVGFVAEKVEYLYKRFRERT